MIPLIPAIITGVKWTAGAVLTGVAGNWVSDKIGIGSDEGLHNPITPNHWENYGLFYAFGAFFLIGFYTIYKMIKKK